VCVPVRPWIDSLTAFTATSPEPGTIRLAWPGSASRVPHAAVCRAGAVHFVEPGPYDSEAIALNRTSYTMTGLVSGRTYTYFVFVYDCHDSFAHLPPPANAEVQELTLLLAGRLATRLAALSEAEAPGWLDPDLAALCEALCFSRDAPRSLRDRRFVPGLEGRGADQVRSAPAVLTRLNPRCTLMSARKSGPLPVREPAGRLPPTAKRPAEKGRYPMRSRTRRCLAPSSPHRPAAALAAALAWAILLPALQTTARAQEEPWFWPARLAVDAVQGPAGLATGDFDGDGLLDVACAVRDSNGVKVYRGVGGGLFNGAVLYPTDSLAHVVVTADLDRDGDLDLAVGNNGGASVTVLLGNGDGSFTIRGNTTVGDSPHAITCGLLNADAIPDLVVSDLDDICVLLGHGDGSFAPAVFYPDIGRPSAAAVDDFNHDLAGDVVVSSFSTDRVLLFRGSADGTLTPAGEKIPLSSRPRDVLSSDFDRDGHRDLAVILSGNARLAVLLGAGDLTFGPPVWHTIPNLCMDGAVGDLDRDGNPDLAVINGSSVTILRGTGTGTFTGGGTLLTGSDASDVAIALMNEDANPDLLTCDRGSDQIGLFLATAPAQFPSAPAFTAGDAPSAVVSGYFNTDSYLDLAVTNFWSDDVSILLGQAGGTFAPQARFAAGNGPMAAVVEDLDLDGDADLAVADMSESRVSILLGTGTGSFGAPLGLTAAGGTCDIRADDFNGDWIPDLVAANDIGSLSVFIGDGDGTFQPALSLPVGFAAMSVRTSDLDDDGNRDLIALDWWGRVVPFRGNGNGTFTPLGAFSCGLDGDAYPCALGVDDLDGDFVPDAVVGFGYANRISRLPGRGDGTFGPPVMLPCEHPLRHVELADMNEDGWNDLVAGGFETYSVGVFAGDGTGSFIAPQTWGGTAHGNRRFCVADLNRDQVPDVAVANYDSDNVSVLLGRWVPSGVPTPDLPRGLRLVPSPNPAGPTGAALRFELAEPGRARVRVIDVRGRLVDTLLDGVRPAGPQRLAWRPGDRGLAPGVYFVRLEAGARAETARLVICR